MSEDSPPHSSITNISNLSHLVIPVKEFCGPSVKDFSAFTDLCEKAQTQNGAVIVHCRMGRGRTGTFIASYLMKYEGIGAQEVNL